VELREKRLDLRAGVIAAQICNANGGCDGQAVGPEDYFPWLKQKTPEPPTDALDQLLAFAAEIGGEIVYREQNGNAA
jgi:hypothetical protein